MPPPFAAATFPACVRSTQRVNSTPIMRGWFLKNSTVRCSAHVFVSDIAIEYARGELLIISKTFNIECRKLLVEYYAQ
jgi:hypothetical protein